jgi:SAM-dependent methyltransferase
MTDLAMPAYTGIENLEVMAEAVNYNAFLGDLVLRHAGPQDRLLDFGAGAGALALPVAAAGHPVTCVEPDATLRARLAEAGLTAHANLDPVPLASLDLIYTVNVLEHIDDDLGTVSGLRDRLRPGGRLVVYVPAFPVLYSSMDRKVGHLRRYRRAGLGDLLRCAGLAIERLAYQDSVGFLAALAFAALGNKDGTINRPALIAYDRCVFPLSRRLDRVAGRCFGKNLVGVARRDA